ncbi:MAG TPA: M10 family metallopeptidase C-terminal domain-containing protein [Allosphingosinicella sp.]|nr:M10 family metallopeptidase C-terminal domain-containing protein [Allosphingosinicella sp.]
MPVRTFADQLAEMARLAALAYLEAPLTLPFGFVPVGDGIVRMSGNDSAEMLVAVNTTTRTLVFSFRGTNPFEADDLLADADRVWGDIRGRAEQFIPHIEEIAAEARFAGYEVWLVGHSLGGMTAETLFAWVQTGELDLGGHPVMGLAVGAPGPGILTPAPSPAFWHVTREGDVIGELYPEHSGPSLLLDDDNVGVGLAAHNHLTYADRMAEIAGSLLAGAVLERRAAHFLSNARANMVEIIDTKPVFGGRFADELIVKAGAGFIEGLGGDDLIAGYVNADLLSGGDGNDGIIGGGGDDRIAGGAGDDVLTGGPGADRFVFGTAFGRDRIVDFRPLEGDVLEGLGNPAELTRAPGIDADGDGAADDTRISTAEGIVDLLNYIAPEDAARGPASLGASRPGGVPPPEQTGFTLSTPTGATNMIVAALADGGFVLAWSAGAYGANIAVQKFTAAGSPAGEVRTVAYSGAPFSEIEAETVVPLADGGFAVLWLNGDLMMQRFDANGNIFREVDGQGRVLHRLFGQAQPYAGSPGDHGSTVAFRPPAWSSHPPSSDQSIATELLPNGNLAIAWGAADSSIRLQIANLAGGSGYSQERILAPAASGLSVTLDLAADGTLLASWQPSGSSILVRQSFALDGTPFTAPAPVPATAPLTAITLHDNVTPIPTPDGDRYYIFTKGGEVWGRWVDASDHYGGPEQLLASGSSIVSSSVAGAVLKNGDLMTVWLAGGLWRGTVFSAEKAALLLSAGDDIVDFDAVTLDLYAGGFLDAGAGNDVIALPGANAQAAAMLERTPGASEFIFAAGEGNDVVFLSFRTEKVDGGPGDDVFYDVDFLVGGGDVVIGGAGHDIAHVTNFSNPGYRLNGQVRSLPLAGSPDALRVALAEFIAAPEIQFSSSGKFINLQAAGIEDYRLLGANAGLPPSLFAFHPLFTLYDGSAGTNRFAADLSGFAGGLDLDLTQTGALEFGGRYRVVNVEAMSLWLGNAADRLTLEAGNDFVDGAGGGDQLRGGGGDDRLQGGAGDDELRGGLGNDILVGGTGADRLFGDEGVDIFTFGGGDSRPLTPRSDGAKLRPDMIGDFTSGQDKIDLTAIDAKQATAANDAFTFIGAAAFTGQAGQLRYTLGGGVMRIEGDMDGDALADFAILAITPVIRASDFFL